MTDVSVGFRLLCWCPSRWAPAAWLLHKNPLNLGKMFLRISQFHKKNCCDLNLGDSVCIFIFFLFSDSGLCLLNSLDFYFDIFWNLNGVAPKTNNINSMQSYILHFYDINFIFCPQAPSGCLIVLLVAQSNSRKCFQFANSFTTNLLVEGEVHFWQTVLPNSLVACSEPQHSDIRLQRPHPHLTQ